MTDPIPTTTPIAALPLETLRRCRSEAIDSGKKVNAAAHRLSKRGDRDGAADLLLACGMLAGMVHSLSELIAAIAEREP